MHLWRYLHFTDGRVLISLYDDVHHKIHIILFESDGGAYHHIHPDDTIHTQCTPTTLSSRHTLIQTALHARNSMLEHPYIHELFYACEMGKVCTRFRWPAVPLDLIRMETDMGEYQLDSLDGNAIVTLSRHGKMLAVKWKCQVNKEKWCWVTQSFGIGAAPERYAYPIKVLLGAWTAAQAGKNVFEMPKESKGKSYIMTECPVNTARSARAGWSTAINDEKITAAEGNNPIRMQISKKEILRYGRNPALPCTLLQHPVEMEKTKEAVFRKIKKTGNVNTVHVQIHADKSVLELTGQIFTHVTCQTPSQVHRYTTYSIPPNSLFLGHGLEYV